MDFSDAVYQQTCQRYKEEWAALDRVLYRMCEELPGHAAREAVNAKVWIIARAYATGIERHIYSDGGQGNSLLKLANHFQLHNQQIDSLLTPLRSLTGPLTLDQLKQIVHAHGLLTNLTAQVTRMGNNPRSFASKYLHFHCPQVPIYDSNALKTLKGWRRWQSWFVEFPISKEADPEYYYFVCRFWQFHQLVAGRGLDCNVKSLDFFLLNYDRKATGILDS